MIDERSILAEYEATVTRYLKQWEALSSVRERLVNRGQEMGLPRHTAHTIASQLLRKVRRQEDGEPESLVAVRRYVVETRGPLSPISKVAVELGLKHQQVTWALNELKREGLVKFDNSNRKRGESAFVKRWSRA